MVQMSKHQFPEEVIEFRESRLPEIAVPVGYAALIDAFDLQAPLPLTLCAIGSKHKVYEKNGWRVYTPRHKPDATLQGHLGFAFKYEGLDLAVLKRFFQAVKPADLEYIITAKPNSGTKRRIWFLYEWLLDQQLDIRDAKVGRYVEAIDTKLQWGVKGTNSIRHYIRNNLPGTADFCPLVRRTDKLVQFINMKLDTEAQAVIGRIPKSILARTASFLLLKDSKASYVIEGESPPHTRIQRWGRAIGEAGKHPLDEDEYLRLQKLVIGASDSLINLGFRTEGGFVGERQAVTNVPLPEHISARHQDLPSLMHGLIDFAKERAVGLDPVIVAATLAFGFVYIHPFEDGNGRIHRYLIHHVLSTRGFNPAGLVFPVSAVILDRIEEYERILNSYSSRLLPAIKWTPTERLNVDVLNDTGDFYRYFDATPHAEFLYECVKRTIERDLPDGAVFLERHEQFKARVNALIEMPGPMLELLFNFLKQNEGRLSKRARSREFSKLSDEQAESFEAIYRDLFNVNHTPL